MIELEKMLEQLLEQEWGKLMVVELEIKLESMSVIELETVREKMLEALLALELD